MAVARDKYIADRFSKFSDLMSKAGQHKENRNYGKADQVEDQAWFEFGRALHPVMDSTSPVHNMEWRKRDGLKHGDNINTQENLSAAKRHRNETVSKMRRVGGS
jgi:hypothetical protein